MSDVALVLQVARIAARRVGNLDPSDALQVACEGALYGVRTWDERRGMDRRGWLFACARVYLNRAIRAELGFRRPQSRKGKRIAELLQAAPSEPLDERAACPAPTPEDVAAELERSRRLREAVEALSDLERAALRRVVHVGRKSESRDLFEDLVVRRLREQLG